MLGFVIGCIVALTVRKDLDERDKSTVSPPAATSTSSLPPKLEATPVAKVAGSQLSLFEMEAVFVRWQNKAVWRHELTEVAFWNPSTNKYSEFVEVLRSGEDLYFRTVPRLTRPILDDHMEPSVPIRFTELEETRAARRAPFMIPPR